MLVTLKIENYNKRIQNNIELLSEVDITGQELQKVGEEMATMLGVVLETKMRVKRIINRLKELP